MPTNKRTRPNGAGSVYQIKTGKLAGRWAAAVTFTTLDGRRKRKTLTAHNKTEADSLLLGMRSDILQGNVLSTDRQTLSQFLSTWLEDVIRPDVRQTSYEKYRNIVERHVAPTLGKRTLASLTPQMIQAFVNQQRKTGLSNTTVADHLGLLKQALRQACKYGLLTRNPASLVDAPTAQRPKIRVFTKVQAQAFVEAVRGDRLEAAFLVLIGLGLRRGETLGLKWEDVDFEHGQLHIRRQLVGLPTGKALFKVKTEESEGTLHMPLFVLQALQRHKECQLAYKRAMGVHWHEHGMVFTNLRGGFLEPSTLKYRFQKILNSVGLPHMRIHDLRHSAGTLMLAMNVPQKVVQDILRHKSPTMTARYLHTLDSMKDDAAKRMDDLLG